jgi:succinate-acetate transporter protein
MEHKVQEQGRRAAVPGLAGTNNGRVSAGEEDRDAVGRHAWERRTRVVLTPIAAPSILGLFGFMGATVMFGAWFAGWYGNAGTPKTLFPFAAVFGGLVQLIAGLYCYRARDGLGTAVHGTWGAFWIAIGIQYLLVTTGQVVANPLGVAQPAFAFWFIVLTVITFSGALAASFESLGTTAVLIPLCVGSAFAAAGLWGGHLSLVRVSGWLFVIAAGIAWYVATAMMLQGSARRTILPLGAYRKAANVPGQRAFAPLEYHDGLPGARVGQ